jgi:hypothetical protein
LQNEILLLIVKVFKEFLGSLAYFCTVFASTQVTLRHVGPEVDGNLRANNRRDRQTLVFGSVDSVNFSDMCETFDDKKVGYLRQLTEVASGTGLHLAKVVNIETPGQFR